MADNNLAARCDMCNQANGGVFRKYNCAAHHQVHRECANGAEQCPVCARDADAAGDGPGGEGAAGGVPVATPKPDPDLAAAGRSPDSGAGSSRVRRRLDEPASPRAAGASNNANDSGDGLAAGPSHKRQRSVPPVDEAQQLKVVPPRPEDSKLADGVERRARHRQALSEYQRLREEAQHKEKGKAAKKDDDERDERLIDDWLWRWTASSEHRIDVLVVLVTDPQHRKELLDVLRKPRGQVELEERVVVRRLYQAALAALEQGDVPAGTEQGGEEGGGPPAGGPGAVDDEAGPSTAAGRKASK